MRLLFAFFLIVLLLHGNNSIAQSINVGTYNLRYDNPADSGNLWRDRVTAVKNLIAFYDFDVLGTQEGLLNQLKDISNALPGYARYGVGRDDGIAEGEHSAIFYKKDRFSLLAKGNFWLSETPHVPSYGWDARCCRRLCSWVQLSDTRAGKNIWVFNVHYDHEGKTARKESSKLIIRKMREIAGDGIVILTGDFNGGRSSEWYKQLATSGLVEDTYERSVSKLPDNPSYNGFGRQIEDNEVIDHIFVTSHFSVRRWGIIAHTFHGRYPSDHFPVLAELSYK